MGVYENWLFQLPGIGNKREIALIEYFASAKGVYEANRKDLEGVRWNQKKLLTERNIDTILDFSYRKDLNKYGEILKSKNIKMTTYGTVDYPEKLKHIEKPPFQLFHIGDLPEKNKPTVAIIGARECTAYGENIARRLGNACGKNKIDVISGMAKGIDGIAQLAAIQAKGRSFGVLGSGVDVCYPMENKGLYEMLKDNGGLLSEYPPGTLAKSNLFPQRNRIISAISDAIIVVESREKSGTKITVEMALEQGRDVYVVPGRITDGLSEGCNQLIKEGAQVITSIEGFLEEFILDMRYKLIEKEIWEDKIFENKGEEEVYKIIDYQPQKLNDLLIELKGKQEMLELMEHILSLEMKQYIKRVGVNSYVLNR